MSLLKKPALMFPAAVAALIAIAACGDGDSDGPSPAPGLPDDFDPSICIEMPMEVALLFELATGDDRLGVRAARMVRSPNTERTWFIAADIEGPGYEGMGPIEVWWAYDEISRRFDSLSGELVDFLAYDIFLNSITPANSVASEFFNPGDQWRKLSGELGEVPDEVQGADLAEQCVIQALYENPDETTGGHFFRPGQWFIDFRFETTLLMLVDIDFSTPECLVLPFHKTGNGQEYTVGGRPYETRFPFPITIYQCRSGLLDRQVSRPEVVTESIAPVYRYLVDPNQPRIAPAVTPTPGPSATPKADGRHF